MLGVMARYSLLICSFLFSQVMIAQASDPSLRETALGKEFAQSQGCLRAEKKSEDFKESGEAGRGYISPLLVFEPTFDEYPLIRFYRSEAGWFEEETWDSRSHHFEYEILTCLVDSSLGVDRGLCEDDPETCRKLVNLGQAQLEEFKSRLDNYSPWLEETSSWKQNKLEQLKCVETLLATFEKHCLTEG